MVKINQTKCKLLMLLKGFVFTWFILYTFAANLNQLNVPVNFHIEYYTNGISGNPRKMIPIVYNNTQIVYVGASDGIHALIDHNSDNSITSSTEDYIIWSDFTPRSPGNYFGIEISSIAFNKDATALYVTLFETTKKCVANNEYSSIHEQVFATQSIECTEWFSSTPHNSHGWHYTEMHPIYDTLCLSFGNEGNMPNAGTYPNDWPTDIPQRTISCFNDMDNPSTSDMTLLADGVRDCVGFTFKMDANDQLWFTDHNRDNYGNGNEYVNKTDGELNKLSLNGEHFGYPWCHSTASGDAYLRDAGSAQFILDSDEPWKSQFNDVNECQKNFTKPVQGLGPHVAPNGLRFYAGFSSTNWPDKYLNSLFIAQHGSWNRPNKIGYRVVSVILDSNDEVIEHNVFVDGWSTFNSNWGRPTDVAVLNDGSILISEDNPGSILRVHYVPPPTEDPTLMPTDVPTMSPSNNPSVYVTNNPTNMPSKMLSTTNPTADLTDDEGDLTFGSTEMDLTEVTDENEVETTLVGDDSGIAGKYVWTGLFLCFLRFALE